MGIPAQVLQAAEMAEELHSKMFTMNASSEDGDSTSTEDPDTEDTEDTEEADEDTSTKNYEDEDDDIEEQVPHDDDVEELRKFKARYLSLRGKYNAELPRLHQELKELKQSVFQKLEQQIDQRQEQVSKQQEPDKLTAFKEEYGEDFVESLRALIQAEADAKIQATIKPVQDQVSSVEDTQVKAAQQSFMGYLDETVKGDWKGLWEGKDPKFIEFLNQPDPSGLYTYGDLVQQYNNNWDADRLAKVFNAYLDSKPQPKPKQEQPNPAKQAMVAPSRSTQHTAPKTNDKIIWTKDAIKEFEKNDRMGKYNPEQSKAMWEDLLSAVAENRVR